MYYFRLIIFNGILLSCSYCRGAVVAILWYVVMLWSVLCQTKWVVHVCGALAFRDDAGQIPTRPFTNAEAEFVYGHPLKSQPVPWMQLIQFKKWNARRVLVSPWKSASNSLPLISSPCLSCVTHTLCVMTCTLWLVHPLSWFRGRVSSVSWSKPVQFSLLAHLALWCGVAHL